MKKTAWLAILTILTLALGCFGMAQAEILPPYGEGQIGLQAVVLCQSLTVREQPISSAKAVKTLHDGDLFVVRQQADGWAECFLSDAQGEGPSGWVNMEYIAINPAWYKTDASTPVYAWGDTDAPKVALLTKNVTLPILKDNGDWIVVGLRGASGWIRVPSGTPRPAAPSSYDGSPAGLQDGERYETTIVLEGMAETVRYEHVRNGGLGIEMDYDYELFVRYTTPDREFFVSRYDTAGEPQNYIEVRHSAEDASTAAASVGQSLMSDYQIVTEPYTLAGAGSCIRIDASVDRSGQYTPAHLQTVYIIPTDDGCLIATSHCTAESAEGFGARFRAMLNTLVVSGN